MMSVFSIFRFALAHKLVHTRLPLAPSIKTSPPAPQLSYPKPPLSLCFFGFLQPVRLFAYEVVREWLPRNKLLAEQDLEKQHSHTEILIQKCADVFSKLFYTL